MSQLSEILSFGIQARVDMEGGARTIVGLLRAETMDGADGVPARRPTLKERLGLKALACCGANWGLGPTSTTTAGSDDEEEEQETGSPRIEPVPASAQDPADNRPGPPCGAPPQTALGMNLAAALAAERQLRVAEDSAPGTPARVSLMTLLEETEEEAGFGWVCCVCMVRKKGAAFIPCGHTYCRVCSRELWLNRGACPLCNRPIMEILDIY